MLTGKLTSQLAFVPQAPAHGFSQLLLRQAWLLRHSLWSEHSPLRQIVKGLPECPGGQEHTGRPPSVSWHTAFVPHGRREQPWPMMKYSLIHHLIQIKD